MGVVTRDLTPVAVNDPKAARIVEATLQRSSQIATLPAVAVQIIQLTEDPDSTIEDLNKVILNDPALGVRILKLVNSAFYGAPGQVSSVKRAILLLGSNAVKNIAIAVSLVKLFRGGKVNPDFDARELWTHSLAVASAAQMLAKKTALFSPDEAFLAGLIHDVGIMVEMQIHGLEFARIIKNLTADDSLTFRQAEAEVLGATHEAFGFGLCKSWHFPEHLQLVTGYHHRPWGLAESCRTLPTLVHVADILAARHRLGYTRTVETEHLDTELLASVKLTEEILETVGVDLERITEESRAVLSDGL